MGTRGGTYGSHLHRLNILHKQAIRLVSNQSYLANTEDTDLANTWPNLLTLHDIHNCFLAILLYKHRNSSLYHRSHIYNTRHRQDLLPSYRGLTTFSGPRVWNSLTDNVKNSRSLTIFKNILKKFIISKYNDEGD